MVDQGRARIAISQVDDNVFRLFIDRCGEAVRITEHQLRRLLAIAGDNSFPGDPAIEAVVAAAREESGFYGELDVDPATAQAVARQISLYRDMAQLSAHFLRLRPLAVEEQRQAAA
jgi:hypothetical protein